MSNVYTLDFILKKIFRRYPELANDRRIILSEITDKPDNSEVVCKIKLDNKYVYRSKHGKILDVNNNLIGCFVIRNNRIKYYIFEDDNKELENIK
jgi:hypothetical protein